MLEIYTNSLLNILGNINLRSKGERNLDYILEAVVNIMPNIFRNVLMDRKVEGTLKKVNQITSLLKYKCILTSFDKIL